ncbi:pyridine nucleotide-disulfide oxidoreductase domain-containing protein 1 [Macrosteles quadrilineatus]|uniref:pyridine nucleotide-disulfide oxidoreductase domain-containing protein 1 n=1 Tax=Macrosteles quadrilineatus TaxID=74068 RepID=UPI0023E20249|nr:pyridine nucleotide-disulfide oxidoreductase domain-containing protein 1 [Macrosteles quadrilineatus]
MEEFDFVIVGGGIAGVSCAESLAFLCLDSKIALITASPLIKAVTNLVPLTKMLTRFDIEEREADTLSQSNPSVTVVKDFVTGFDSIKHLVFLKSGVELKYKKLCLCSGASPKLIPGESKNIVGIRDTESVKDFQDRVQDSSRIVVVGNGGIATEIIYELTGVELIWVIKDEHISANFIDPVAAEFFQDRLLKQDVSDTPPIVKRMKYTVEDDKSHLEKSGAALGPDWHSKYKLQGSLRSDTKVVIEYKSEVDSVLSPEEAKNLVDKSDQERWQTFVKLTNGQIYGCDFIVSATGVVPCCNFDMKCNRVFDKAEDGGIKVDWKMETNLPDIFAAGDVCHASWDRAPHWFQMRLWTQARQMGTYAAKAMSAALKEEQFYQDFCFEMFSHVTKFFGYKVVLLGLFNGQTLANNYEVLLRITKGVEYVKCVMKNGRMQGAVLIGETDLEEMCENLILNQLDLTDFGEDLLNPDIDIEDYFD